MLVHSIYKIDDLYGFKCFGITKLASPIRINRKNEIECFSLDGKKCINNLDNDEKCRQYIRNNIKSAKKLLCKSEEYKDKNHLCYKAKLFYFEHWKCFEHTGIEAAFRINRKTGKIKCLSFDGKTCVQGKKAINLCRTSTNLKKISLTCGKNTIKNHEDVCRRAFAWFKFSGEWLCKNKTNINTPIRLASDGMIECLSENGYDCIWGANTEKKCKEFIGKYTKTVKCKRNKTCNKNCKNIQYRRKFKRNPQIIRYKKCNSRQCKNSSICKGRKCKTFSKVTRVIKTRNWCRLAYLFIYKSFVDFEGIILRGEPEGHEYRSKYIFSYKYWYRFYWRKFKRFIKIIWYIPVNRYIWRIRYSFFWNMRKKYLLWLRWKLRLRRRMGYLWRLRLRLKRKYRWTSRIKLKWRYIWRRLKWRWRKNWKNYNRWKIKIIRSRRFRKSIRIINRFKYKWRFSGYWKRGFRNKWKWQIGMKIPGRYRYRLRRKHSYMIKRRWSNGARYKWRMRRGHRFNSRWRIRRRGFYKKRRFRRNGSLIGYRSNRKLVVNDDDEDEDNKWKKTRRRRIRTSTWR